MQTWLEECKCQSEGSICAGKLLCLFDIYWTAAGFSLFILKNVIIAVACSSCLFVPRPDVAYYSRFDEWRVFCIWFSENDKSAALWGHHCEGTEFAKQSAQWLRYRNEANCSLWLRTLLMLLLAFAEGSTWFCMLHQSQLVTVLRMWTIPSQNVILSILFFISSLEQSFITSSELAFSRIVPFYVMKYATRY